MKLFKFLLVAFLSIALFSCSSDDDGDSDDDGVDFVGTWNLTAIYTEASYDLNADGVESVNFMEETNCYQGVETFSFGPNGIGIRNWSSFAIVDYILTTDTTSDPGFAVNCVDQIYSFTYLWTLEDNNNLTLVNDEDASDVINIEVNNNEIRMVLEDEFLIINEEIVVIEDLTFVYTRE